MSKENEGHRARLRERMLNEGLSSFQDHEILELLLFQSIPRRDTNKIAHNLLNQFGSFAGVLDASPRQLITVDGIGMVAAVNLAMLKEVFLRYKTSDAERMSLEGISSIIAYSKALISEGYTEKVVVVYVDHASRYLSRDIFTSDSTTQVVLNMKDIISSATHVNAAGVIFFHSHGKGLCLPSEEDYHFTEKLLVTLAGINVVLLDHMIFNANGEHYSFYMHDDIKRMREKYKLLI